jgi:phage protein U
MFALLGNIFIQVLTSPQSIRAKTGYHYAEHKVVESAPRLQWTSDGLEKITLQLGFHVLFTNPATQMNLLYLAAETHQALPLVFGNGVFRGYFVIESIEETHQQMADDGSYFALEARMELREWIPGADFDPLAPPQAANPPPGIVSSPAGTATQAFDPLAAISASNVLPSIVVAALSTLGAPAGVTYVAADYVQPGISGLVGTGAEQAVASVGNYLDVAASTIVREG